ncbi:uncharacterized protein LOC127740680 isoform X2 [Arachis duranensis]|uniref:Uncharacterized protein LOC127740680 isoform X2 n=1 Tax=Arachis duranensis TaxID=130453 RepID=A0A9C6T644_ARADU|nr:uncharacterized protein LOC127740680 isoform X2 [Arachis duranensis]
MNQRFLPLPLRIAGLRLAVVAAPISLALDAAAATSRCTPIADVLAIPWMYATRNMVTRRDIHGPGRLRLPDRAGATVNSIAASSSLSSQGKRESAALFRKELNSLRIIDLGRLRKDLYVFEHIFTTHHSLPTHSINSTQITSITPSNMWHFCLSHVSGKRPISKGPIKFCIVVFRK